jgi:hypothetical protein
MAQCVDDGVDFLQGHPIHRFRRDPWCHGAVVAIELSIGAQIEITLVEQTVRIINR